MWQSVVWIARMAIFFIVAIVNIKSFPTTWKEYKTEKSGIKLLELFGRILLIFGSVILFLGEIIDK